MIAWIICLVEGHAWKPYQCHNPIDLCHFHEQCKTCLKHRYKFHGEK